MQVEQVTKLKPLDRFLYWIRERHKIYERREAGKSKPWTDDEVLQSVFFTNPYRENDKTTVWFRENVRDPLRDDPSVLMATVIFRWFNLIATGIELRENGLLTEWNERRCVKLLRGRKPIFTGAYMIKAGNGPPGCKLPNVCKAITTVWKQRQRLVGICEKDCRLEALWAELKKFPHLGGFMSYEIVTDLRHTALLEDAVDVNTWANPGPGARRGLARLSGEPLRTNRKGKLITRSTGTELAEMQSLLKIARRRLKSLPQLELREVEHSLCEWDKYERARLQDGKLKRKFMGGFS